jgi:hypothetical protein
MTIILYICLILSPFNLEYSIEIPDVYNDIVYFA